LKASPKWPEVKLEFNDGLKAGQSQLHNFSDDMGGKLIIAFQFKKDNSVMAKLIIHSGTPQAREFELNRARTSGTRRGQRLPDY